jgi:HlyD family secretion protein
LASKRPLAVAALAIAAAVGGWWAYTHGANDGGALQVSGNVDIRQVDLAFQVEGRIREMPVQEGDRVNKGDILATLDTGYFEDALALARARLAAQQATLAKLEAGSRPQEIASAQADLAAAEAVLANAKTVFKRQDKLAKTSAASRQALDDAESALRQARAHRDAASEALDLVRAGFRDEEIAAARASMKGEEATVALAERRLNDAKLNAPAAGTILTRIKEPGAVIASGTPVFSMSMTDPVWVRAYVSETDLGRIHPGQKARIVTDSRPDAPYAGHVGFISPTAEFTPKSVETRDLRTSLVYRFRVVADNPDQGLRQGMPVTVILDEDAPASKP